MVRKIISARTPEGIVEDHLLSQCKKLGFACYKYTVQGITGVPDRNIVGNGHNVFLELKAPGEKLRRLQEVVVAEMRSKGAIVYVANTIEKVDAVLALLSETGAPSAPLASCEALDQVPVGSLLLWEGLVYRQVPGIPEEEDRLVAGLPAPAQQLGSAEESTTASPEYLWITPQRPARILRWGPGDTP